MRSLAAVLVLLSLAAAGCLSSPSETEDGGGKSLPDVLPDVSFGVPVDVGARVGEPGFRVAPDGTVWVHAPGGLWKSTDNGTTFVDVTAKLEAAGPILGGDADLAIGADGSLYYTDLEMLAAISVFSSHDGGETWFENPIASEVPGDDRQWIATGPDAAPLSLGNEAVYLVFNHLPTNVFLTKSIDGGMTWVGKNVVLTTPQTQFWSMGNMLVDPDDGTIYVVYALGNAVQPVGDGTLPVDYQIRMSTSTDGSLTWTESVVVDPVGNPGQIFPVIALDSEGGLYATWAVEEDGRDLVQIAYSRDKGATWTDPVTLNAEGTSGVMPWVDATVPGHVVVAWYETQEAVLSSDASGPWYMTMATSTDALAANATWSTTRVWDEPVHEGPICTLGIMCSGGRDLLDFFQVRVGVDGAPAIVFADTVHGGGTMVYFAQQTAGLTL